MPPDTSVFVAPGMRAVARAVLGKIRVRVDGVENVPASGPALLVCRHHHHLYDGAALVLAIRRPVRMIVGLDWVKDQGQRAYMEALCAIAGWPVVLRDETEGNPWGDGYRTSERRRYARAALTQSVDVLRRGGVLAMFPEGYPEIDPAGTAGSDAVRPFAPGYLSIAVRAGRAGIDRAAVRRSRVDRIGFAARVGRTLGRGEGPGALRVSGSVGRVRRVARI